MCSVLSQLLGPVWLCLDALVRRERLLWGGCPRRRGWQAISEDEFLPGDLGTPSIERSWPKTPGTWLRRTPSGSPATRPKVVPRGSPPSYLQMASCDNSGQRWTGQGEETGRENISGPRAWFKVSGSHTAVPRDPVESWACRIPWCGWGRRRQGW